MRVIYYSHCDAIVVPADSDIVESSHFRNVVDVIFNCATQFCMLILLEFILRDSVYTCNVLKGAACVTACDVCRIEIHHYNTSILSLSQLRKGSF